MKYLYTTFLWAVVVLVLSGSVQAQQVQWLRSNAISFDLNPAMPKQLLTQNASKVYTARVQTLNAYLGNLFFASFIDCYDNAGRLQWSYQLRDSVCFGDIVADANGNVYVAGTYLETLHLGATDGLRNTGSGLDVNEFLICLDANGNLVWKRNVSLTYSVGQIAALTIDKQNRCWYAFNEGSKSHVTRVDNEGNDVQSHILLGTVMVSSMSFDGLGNVFIAGSAGGIAPLTVNGFTADVNETYTMFLTRIASSGDCSWVRLAHDVTFQKPEVVALSDGSAYIGGDLMDTARWGTVSFDGPQWVYDIFLARADSNGTFRWGYEVPDTPTLSGDFARASSHFIGIDQTDNLYVLGTLRGSVDFGSGVVPSTGAVSNPALAVIQFNKAGTARWSKVSSSVGSYPSVISVSGINECYYAGSITGLYTMDSSSANDGGGFAFLAGKISSEPTDVEETIIDDDMKVFPNPFVDNIYFSNPLSLKHIYMYDAVGRCVKSADITHTLDVHDLPRGVYFLKIGVLGTANVFSSIVLKK